MADTNLAVKKADGSTIFIKIASGTGTDIDPYILKNSVDVLTLPADPLGANADAIVTAGSAGSISAKLRRITQGLEDLKSLIVLAAGNNTIGKLAANDGVDIGDVTINNGSGASAVNIQDGGNAITVDGTVTANLSATDNAVLDSAVAALGATDGTAVITDANGTIQQYLRGLIKLAIDTTPSNVVLTAGAAAIGKLVANSGVDIGDVDVLSLPADPMGANADAIVAAGAAGSISAKLRRITQGLEDLKSLVVLGAGTNAIGKLAANSGVDIGDVDVLTLPADPLGANADAIVAAGATGTISAKLRRITQGLEDLKTLVVLGAGDNNIGNVDIASALPAGTNAIGKLAANSGVDIGDVDVSSIAAGENHLGECGGKLVTVSAEMTRPSDTTAYAIGDVVLNSTSAAALVSISGCARVNAGSGYIVGMTLVTNLKSITPRIRVHIYNASNPTLSNDNAAWQDKYADIAKKVGVWDLPAMTTSVDTTNSDISKSLDLACRIPFNCAAASTTLYFGYETLDAFTPASGEKFTLMLQIDQN